MTMRDRPSAGDIWDYPYLWAWQDDRGETEGRKSRPVAVAVILQRKDGTTVLFLLPITSQQPGAERVGLPVPETERRRAGLSEDMPLWVLLDEFNTDIFEMSFYLHPEERIGRFSAKFLSVIQTAFRRVVKSGNATSVQRSDT